MTSRAALATPEAKKPQRDLNTNCNFTYIHFTFSTEMSLLFKALTKTQKKYPIKDTRIVQGSERKRILESGGRRNKRGVCCDL